MPKDRKQTNAANAKELSLEEILKQLPPPPPEHVHELKMEKRVKQLLKEQKNNKPPSRTKQMFNPNVHGAFLREPPSTAMNHRNQNNLLRVLDQCFKSL